MSKTFYILLIISLFIFPINPVFGQQKSFTDTENEFNFSLPQGWETIDSNELLLFNENNTITSGFKKLFFESPNDATYLLIKKRSNQASNFESLSESIQRYFEDNYAGKSTNEFKIIHEPYRIIYYKIQIPDTNIYSLNYVHVFDNLNYQLVFNTSIPNNKNLIQDINNINNTFSLTDTQSNNTQTNFINNSLINIFSILVVLATIFLIPKIFQWFRNHILIHWK